MTHEAGVTRRQALGLLGVGGAAALLGVGAVLAGRDDGPEPDREPAVAPIPLLEALVVLGTAVRATHPGLADEADEVIGPDLTAEGVREDPARALGSRRDQIAADYAAGEVLDVDGWILSRTECALAALVVPQS